MSLRVVLGACALLACAGEAAAVESFSFAVGRAPGVVSLQGGLAWNALRGEGLPQWLDWTGADLRLELAASVWRGQGSDTARGTLVGVGVMPLLRWPLGGSAEVQPFIDFGVGPRLWSGRSIAPGHRFGTAFEFGTVLGAGLHRGVYDIFVRVEHTSNGGIRQPNPGINFLQLGVSKRLGR